MHAPTVAQQNPTGLPKSEILPLCCGTSELLHPADVGGYRGRGYPWVQNEFMDNRSKERLQKQERGMCPLTSVT